MAPRASLVTGRSVVRVFIHMHLFLVLLPGHSRLLTSLSGSFLAYDFLPEGDKLFPSFLHDPSFHQAPWLVCLGQWFFCFLPLLPFNDEIPWVLPESSRRLWNVERRIDFSSLEFCCFFEPEFCMSVTQHCWVGGSFRVVPEKASELKH